MEKSLNEGTYAIRSYLKDICKYPLLNADEEKELSRRINECNDKEAYEKLVNSNLRLVISIAKIFKDKGVLFEDLISEGNIGLMKAAKKYDSSLGYRFSTYATPAIRRSLYLAIANQSRTIRIPTKKSEDLYRIKKNIDRIISEGKTPTLKKISEYTGFDDSKILSLPRDEEMSSLNMEMHNPKARHGFLLEEIIADEKNPSAEDCFLDTNFKKLINENLDSLLSEKEKDIIEKIFGLNGKPRLTLKKICKEYNVTPVRIGQIGERALKKLRKNSDVWELNSYFRT